MALIESIKNILKSEAEAILAIPIDSEIERAIALIVNCKGKLFTTGIGKAGYVARKAASTFSTTGTPSVFLHPGDASHGDVGVVSRQDAILAFSNSGYTREVVETVHFCKKLGIPSVITITSNRDSELAKLSEVVICTGRIAEACPFGLTPTSSTAVMTALSDALALVAMEQKGFTKEDFAIRHHGGYIGKQLAGK